MVITILLALGCAPSDPSAVDRLAALPPVPAVVDGCSLTANLELVPLDSWGRDLSGATWGLDREPDLVSDPAAGPGVMLLPLGSTPVDLTAVLRADDYEGASVKVRWEGAGGAAGFSLETDDHAVATWEERTIAGRACPVYTVFLAPEHRWFAAAGRAPSLSGATLYLDGEDTWAAVAQDMAGVSRRLTWSTWWWESSFELVRPWNHATLSEAQREQNTVMSLFEALPGVERRLLLNRFWADNLDAAAALNSDSALLAKAEAAGDDFEVIFQANTIDVPVEGQYDYQPPSWSLTPRLAENPRYAARTVVRTDPGGEAWRQSSTLQVASWHQKAMVMDGEVAWVVGMNSKGTDWDGVEHRVYDARRMPFDATASEREDVVDGVEIPEFEPRKDFAVRLEGPAVRDVEEILHQRWESSLAGGELYADRATPFTLDPAPASPGGAVQVQIGATMPPPFNDLSILETQRRALSQAEDLILIEDQYFRAPILNEVIAARMFEKPELRLIVVTMDVSTWDGGSQWTHLTDAWFADQFPGRYQLLTLVASDLYLDEGYLWDTVELVEQPIFTHSKLRIVDDRYLSVGSANYNNRGYLYEGELNASVLDQDFVREARARVMQNWVGPRWAGQLTGDGAHDFEVVRQAAAENRAVLDWWEENGGDLDVDEALAAKASHWTSGFLVPLTIAGDYEWDVGPDLF
ncbi:MAG: hypothetical protein JXX28_06700 [Deltaproteobacteria bacterium]|nr:hypothetical protein [Deltaproteobacteria bacterium]